MCVCAAVGRVCVRDSREREAKWNGAADRARAREQRAAAAAAAKNVLCVCVCVIIYDAVVLHRGERTNAGIYALWHTIKCVRACVLVYCVYVIKDEDGEAQE